jgi:Na+-transporting NADH:ubiquinone oxidoreductase subunit NqrB
MRHMPSDPRVYQIAALTLLLGYGGLFLHFDVTLWQVLLTLGTTFGAQAVCSRLFRLPRIELRSALISGLSLCLLLRTNSALLVVATAMVTISSKFLLRWRGKHLFNPTNFGLMALLLVTGQIWVSPGQWGAAAFFGFLLVCLGGCVVYRAARADVTLAFLFFHTAILFGRSWWLGEPVAIPLHRLQSGSLLLFAFFMISDPKTTPDSRAGRILFALAVALGGAFVQFSWHRPNGLLWSLAGSALLVPVLDSWLPGHRYSSWSRPALASESGTGTVSMYAKKPIYENAATLRG